MNPSWNTDRSRQIACNCGVRSDQEWSNTAPILRCRSGTSRQPADNIYAAGADHPNWSGDQAVVVRSVDDGASWTVVFTRSESSRIEVVAIDPTNAGVVYIGGEACDEFGCEGLVYRTRDGGDTWEHTLALSNTVTSLVADPQKPDVLYAADRGYTVYKSTDGGGTWLVVRYPPPQNSSGYLLAIDPHVPSHVYLGGWGYIAETPDGGQTWKDWPINNGTPLLEARSLVVSGDTPTQTLYAGFSGAWAYTRPHHNPVTRRALSCGPNRSPTLSMPTTCTISFTMPWYWTATTIGWSMALP